MNEFNFSPLRGGESDKHAAYVFWVGSACGNPRFPVPVHPIASEHAFNVRCIGPLFSLHFMNRTQAGRKTNASKRLASLSNSETRTQPERKNGRRVKQTVFASVATIALLETIAFVAGRGLALGFALGALSMLIIVYRELDEVKK